MTNPTPPTFTGDKVTRRARPQRVPARAPFRQRLTQGGAQRVPMPEQVVGTLAVYQGLASKMVDRLEALEGSPVLLSGTFMITADGHFGRGFQVPYATVHLFNQSASHPMTLSAGGAGDHSVPLTQGAAVHTIPFGHWVTVPMIGNSLNVIGTPSDLFRLIVLSRFSAPAAG